MTLNGTVAASRKGVSPGYATLCETQETARRTDRFGLYSSLTNAAEKQPIAFRGNQNEKNHPFDPRPVPRHYIRPGTGRPIRSQRQGHGGTAGGGSRQVPGYVAVRRQRVR